MNDQHEQEQIALFPGKSPRHIVLDLLESPDDGAVRMHLVIRETRSHLVLYETRTYKHASPNGMMSALADLWERIGTQRESVGLSWPNFYEHVSSQMPF